MVDISILNAMGDAVLAAAVLYAAYQVREHKKIAFLYVLIALAFFASSAAFARNLTLFEFYAIIGMRMFVFSVLFVEVMKYMVGGFEKIRIAYLLYASNIVFAFKSSLDIVAAYATVFVVSSLVLATAFSFLIAVKKGNTRLFSLFGLLGVLFNLLMLATEISFIFVPWTIVFLPGRIFLIIFFIGFAYYTHNDMYHFYDEDRLKLEKKVTKQ